MFIDISRPIRDAMDGYPGDPAVRLVRDPDVDAGGEYSFTSIQIHSHCGTHLDAPRHFIPGGRELGDFPLEAFCPLAEVLDCRGVLDISAAQLQARLRREDSAVLLLTDASEWPDDNYRAQHPGLTEEAASFLVGRSARLLGIDYFSVERDGPQGYPVHRILLGAGFLLLEHICLRDVPEGLYSLLCLPLKLENAEAAPCRAILASPEELR